MVYSKPVERFRKRPIVVEAEQFFPDDLPWPDGVHLWPLSGQVESYRIETLEGWLVVSPGDWIITGINGEKYPCNPDIFHKTYEVVDPQSEQWPNE